MRHFAYCRADGVIQQTVSVGDESAVAPPDIAGLTCVEIDRPATGYVLQAGVFVPSTPSDADLAAAARAARDRLLDVTDRTQVADTALAAQQVIAWRQLRTALRNLPQQPGFPRSITWPTTPDGADTTPPALVAPLGPAPVVIPPQPVVAPPPIQPLPPPPGPLP